MNTPRRKKRKSNKHSRIPDSFIRPITRHVMKDPVSVTCDACYYMSDGHRHTFERAAITAWFAKHLRCPIDGSYANPRMLKVEPDLQHAIATYGHSLGRAETQQDHDYEMLVQLRYDFTKRVRMNWVDTWNFASSSNSTVCKPPGHLPMFSLFH
jgi:hypothetical protein